MGDKGTLANVFIDKLREAYDAEKRLAKGLKRVGRAAQAPALRTAFAAHLEETRAHQTRIEEAFDLLNTKRRRRPSVGMAGILKEAKALTKRDLDAVTMDACLIAVAQAAEHYEIAAYGTLVAWARRWGKEDVTDILIAILEEEKAADEALSMLAEDEGVNQAAIETVEDDRRTAQDDDAALEESDDVGPPLASERRVKATSPTKPDLGARGDRKAAGARKRIAKKK